MDLNTLIFNGINSLEHLGVIVQSYPSINIPDEDYEQYSVIGRNGSLTVNKGTYGDIKISFELSLLKYDDFNYSIDRINNWLNNITDKRLFYDREDRCYIVKKVLKEGLKRLEQNKGGEFKITFICEPFMSDPNDTSITITQNSFEFYNNGNMNSNPTTKIYGNGTVELNLNGNIISIKNLENYVELNSHLLQSIDSNKRSKDLDCIGNFPIVLHGINRLSWTGNINKIELNYRANYR